MIRNFVPNLWSKPVNPRMGVVLTLLIARNGRIEPGGAFFEQCLSLSLSYSRALRFLSLLFSVVEFFEFFENCTNV